MAAFIRNNTQTGTSPVAAVSFAGFFNNYSRKNMNKKLFAAVVLAAVTALPAAAQESGWYAAGSLGRSKYDFDGQAGDNKDTSYNLGVGYNFSKNVGVEIGYADFGKASVQGVTGQAQSGYIGVILSASLSDAFSVYTRLAAASTNRKISASGYGFSVSDRKTEAFLGLGVGYAFQKNLTGTLEYQTLNDSDVSAINLGLRLSF